MALQNECTFLLIVCLPCKYIDDDHISVAEDYCNIPLQRKSATHGELEQIVAKKRYKDRATQK